MISEQFSEESKNARFYFIRKQLFKPKKKPGVSTCLARFNWKSADERKANFERESSSLGRGGQHLHFSIVCESLHP